MLLFQEDEVRALAAAEKALSLDPKHETARRVRAELK